MLEFDGSAMFNRNLGFMTTAEQDKMHEATVAIAGVGGDGALLAVQLARMGVESMRLADPDPFEVENINRQATCRTSTVGVNKAEAVANYLEDINPRMQIKLFTKGVQESNVSSFVDGSTLVVDETEYTLPELGIMIAREARPRNIPVLTALNIGFGALVTTFQPDGVPLERQLGFKVGDSLEHIREHRDAVKISRWLPYVPGYGDLGVLDKVAKGEKSAPSIAPGVAIAAAIGATQAFLNIVGAENHRPHPVFAPRAHVVDAMTGASKIVKFGPASHYRHLSTAIVRNLMGKYPRTSY